jgi:hypothetical protein
MNKPTVRDLSHASNVVRAALLGLTIAAAQLAGCASGNSGDAPGLAPGQSADPVTLDFPLAYIKRPLPALPAGDMDIRDMITPMPGGDVYVRDKASPSGIETNITKDITLGDGDVRDLDVSPDGAKLVFSLRLPLIPNATDDEQPTWNIWEYDAKAKTLHRVIVSDIIAEEGHDRAPRYLPDGRIVFTSTRQRTSKAIQLDEGKPQYAAQTEDRRQAAFMLHVMDAAGTNIHQIAFNPNHDTDPAVLNNGQIVFTRWHRDGPDAFSLFRANPDGTGLESYYGANSHATGTNASIIQFMQPRVRLDGRVLVVAKPFMGTLFGGDLLFIDGEKFAENNQPTLTNAGAPGPAQTRATTLDVSTEPNVISLGGRFHSAFPLLDGTPRMLVSWSPCFIVDASVTPAVNRACTASNITAATSTEAPPSYSIWMSDPTQQTLRPIITATAGTMVVEPVIMQARTPAPPQILDKVAGVDLDQKLVSENVGLLDVRSVYDIDGVDTATPNIATLADPKVTTADQRPARFVRIEKMVPIPDRQVRDVNNSAFGPAGLGMRDILAYAPVEPDGSIRLKVPANVPFAVDVLDKDGKTVSPRHSSWLQLRPGEVHTCNGCHNPATPTSHGRADLLTSINAGATNTGQPFPNTEPALFADFGDTMAQTRARISCAVTANCSLTPSVNVLYDDVWTDPVAAARAKDLSFAYLYSDLSTPPPTTSACMTTWTFQCRITIHYLAHIQPLWKLLRQTPGPGATVIDHTCVLCHSPKDAANAAQVPAGQLDLTDSQSAVNPDYVTSYQQLLFTHDQLQLIMGALQPVTVPGPIDPVTGVPTQITLTVGPSLQAGSALASATFFSRFSATGTHAGYLTAAELRLIAEWVDIGAQYYNDPFVAPVN